MTLRGQWKEWLPGDPVTVNRIVWGQPEIDQIQDVLDNDWFGPGPKVGKFGTALAEFTGIPYCQPVNSGSSALTLAVETMLALGHWRPGDLILHPLLTFPTSIAPVIRAGLTPLFVDVDPQTYQIDLARVEFAMRDYDFKHRIAGAVIPHLLGNICDMKRLLELLDGRPLIEDCCDTLGGYYDDKHVGSFGHVAAFSFYGSHHITTGGVGGALLTDDAKIYDIAKSLTHWGRNDYDQLPAGYKKFSRRYWYDTMGYDFQMTELQAAFGIVQLARVPKANVTRRQRFAELDQFFRENDLADYFYLPETDSIEAAPSWFAYPITVKESAPFRRKEFAMHLLANKIEIRPLFTGNILKHPAFRLLTDDRRAVQSGPSTVADRIGKNALFLPAWGMSDGEMAYLLEVLAAFLMPYKQNPLAVPDVPEMAVI
jgi:CDP-6-deoxy-D-xylo-4-hexulose-3-dehydrase